jgi:peptidase YpeB-like protein
MKDKMKGILIAGAAIAALAIGGAAIAGATGGKDSEKPITGSALDKAKAAALKHTGGGQVKDSEAGDEEGAYQVEVKRTDGSTVDVNLDSGFNVINAPADEESSGDQDGSGE